MVLILSDKENKIDRQIIEILSRRGAAIVTDDRVFDSTSRFTAVSLHNKTKIETQKGIAIVTDGVEGFRGQHLPKELIGICDEKNKNALALFKRNKLPTITCGRGGKNTLSVSSVSDDGMLLCLQRSITDINGGIIEPCEIKVALSKNADLFSCLASIAVMLVYKALFIDGDTLL